MAARAKPYCPRLMVRSGKVAVPAASVVCVRVPPRVAAAQGGVPLKPMETAVLGIGVLLASVTRTETGEPVSTWPSMELCGGAMKMTLAGGTVAVPMVTV